MPSGVVFTTSAWSARAAALASQSTMRSPARSRANASARAEVRLLTVTHAPASNSAAPTARAEPPPPISSAGGAHAKSPEIRDEAAPFVFAAGVFPPPKHQGVDRAGTARGVVHRIAD